MSAYMLVRVKKAWVPWWLWRMATKALPLARLLSEHVMGDCECPCHGTPGMRDCGFCR